MKELNNKQKVFCREYVKNGNNGTTAYMKAYKCKETTARINASKLLTNTNISEYIKELQEKLEDHSIMSAKERMQWLTNVVNGKVTHTSYDSNGNAYDNEAYISDKLKAIDVLNKMSGEYITKVEADVSVNEIVVDIEDE